MEKELIFYEFSKMLEHLKALSIEGVEAEYIPRPPVFLYIIPNLLTTFFTM
jgi:hypothetical protein